jgi:hypothetical protein
LSDTSPLEIDSVLREARRRAGLENLGSEWILEPLNVYLRALRTEANLSAEGANYACETILRGLVNRLRMIEAIRLHPEILDENLTVLAAILGLPRSGSTMLQRIISSVPGINGVLWWELQNFAPFPGEVFGQPTERIQFAQKMVADWLAAAPEFAAIHPISATEVDEDSVLLHHMCSGALEFRYTIPSFVEWQNTADFSGAYQDLCTILKFLQWQQPARRGNPWVLKAPEHLIAIEELLRTFPDCKVIVTHRNPVQTIPSLCSMFYTIQRIAAAQPDRLKIGRGNRRRWVPTLERFTALRDRIGDERFFDITYRDLLKDPLGVAQRTLAALGMTLDSSGRAAIETWLEENARDQRAAHEYSAAEYGLSERELESDFANYISRFLPGELTLVEARSPSGA